MSLRNVKTLRIVVATLLLVGVAVRVAMTRVEEKPPTTKPRPLVALEDFSQASAGGCGNILLYKQAGPKVLSVQLTLSAKNLDKSVGSFLGHAQSKRYVETQFDLSSPVNGLQVEVQVWDGFQRFCDCIPTQARLTATWTATSGKLTMTAHGPTKGSNSDSYFVSAVLEDVVFEDEHGRQVWLKKESIPQVGVGWYAG